MGVANFLLYASMLSGRDFFTDLHLNELRQNGYGLEKRQVEFIDKTTDLSYARGMKYARLAWPCFGVSFLVVIFLILIYFFWGVVSGRFYS